MRIISKAEVENMAGPSIEDLKTEIVAIQQPLDVIEMFHLKVESGEVPPNWLLHRVSRSFGLFLDNNGKKKLESCFEITKGQFKERVPDNTCEAMASYAFLLYLFDMDHRWTAEVVKLWYKFPPTLNADTLKQKFQRDYSQAYDSEWVHCMDHEINITERAAQFLNQLKIDHQEVFQKLNGYKKHFRRNAEIFSKT